MGSSPKISGGMTFGEQEKLMKDEREFQEKQEKERRLAAEEAETRRATREAAERIRIKQMEQKEIAEATKGEQEALLEAQAQQTAASADPDSIGGANAALLDFYSNLYRGTTP